MRLIWRAVQIIWVLSPLFGLLPNTHPRLAGQWWWTVSSLLVIAASLGQSTIRKPELIWPTFLLLALLSYLFHLDQPEALAWLYPFLIVFFAAFLIVERGDLRLIQEAFLLAAYLQIPLMLAQATGIHLPWERAGGDQWPISGSLSRRVLLGSVMATACCLSRGWRARLFAAGAILSASWTGAVPALIRIIWLHTRFRKWLLWIAPIGLVATLSLWQAHLGLRVKVWLSLDWWQGLVGQGFTPFTSGFVDPSYAGSILGWLDYHNTFLDLIARFGLVGLVGISLFVLRLSSAPLLQALMLWLLTWQSAESSPALILLMILPLLLTPTREADRCV